MALAGQAGPIWISNGEPLLGCAVSNPIFQSSNAVFMFGDLLMIVQLVGEKIADLSCDIGKGENLRGEPELAIRLTPRDDVEALDVGIESAGEPLKAGREPLFDKLNAPFQRLQTRVGRLHAPFQRLETMVRLLRFVSNLLQHL